MLCCKNTYMNKIYFKNASQTKLNTINRFAKDCWIDIVKPDVEDFKILSEKLNLQPSVIEDILDANEIPKVEKIDDNVLIILKIPTSQKRNKILGNFAIIINPICITTISSTENQVITNVVNEFKGLHTSQSPKLFFRLLDTLSIYYRNNIEKIVREIELQKKSLDQVNDKKITQLVLHEEQLNYYNLAVQPTKYIINKILKGKTLPLFEEDEEDLQDIYEEFNQLAEICILNLKGIVTLRDSYKILMDLNLNKTIKILTSLTIIITIPTIVGSIFGMNVDFPMSMDTSGFYIIMFSILALIGAVIGVFYWKKWL